MKNIYMQDKRAKKHTPPIGTKKYPLYFLGVGKEEGGVLKTDGMFPFEIKARYFRYYGSDENEGVWFKNVSAVQFGCYWRP